MVERGRAICCPSLEGGTRHPGLSPQRETFGRDFLSYGIACLWKSPRKRQDRDEEQAAHSHAGAAHRSISKLHSPIPQTFSQPQLPSWDVQPARLKEDGRKSGSDTARMRG